MGMDLLEVCSLIKKFFGEPEEFWVGFGFAACWIPFFHWWSLITIPLCGILWKLGGWEHGNRYFRRIGVPSLLFTSFYLAGKGLVWPSLALFGILSLGYGIPDFEENDEGSALGSFWYDVFHDNEVKATIATRFTLGILMVGCLYPLLWQQPIAYLIGAILWPFLYVLIERKI